MSRKNPFRFLMPRRGQTDDLAGSPPSGGGDITLALTKDECDALIQMLFVALWIMSSNEDDPPPDIDRFESLEQRVLALAKNAGFDDVVRWDRHERRYYTTMEYEDRLISGVIDKYNNDVFWNELADRLAERDVIEEFGREKFDRMHPAVRDEHIAERSDWYYEEFLARGVDHLKLKARLEVVK